MLSLTSNDAQITAQVGSLLKLTKPGIVVTNAMMAGVGTAVAGRPDLVVPVGLGVALLVAGCGAANQELEADIDARMPRTSRRPVADGIFSRNFASGIATFLLIAGSLVLAIFGGLGAALLGVLACVIYVGIYTPLKRVSWVAIPVGAVSGAIPPLIGWAAAHVAWEATAWLLFGALFVWQLPHFLAISIRRAKQYLDAGFAIGCRDHQLQNAVRWARILSVVLLALSAGLVVEQGASFILGLAGAALPLGFAFTKVKVPELWAKRLFFSGLAYLPLMTIAALLHG